MGCLRAMVQSRRCRDSSSKVGVGRKMTGLQQTLKGFAEPSEDSRSMDEKDQAFSSSEDASMTKERKPASIVGKPRVKRRPPRGASQVHTIWSQRRCLRLAAMPGQDNQRRLHPKDRRQYCSPRRSPQRVEGWRCQRVVFSRWLPMDQASQAIPSSTRTRARSSTAVAALPRLPKKGAS